MKYAYILLLIALSGCVSNQASQPKLFEASGMASTVVSPPVVYHQDWSWNYDNNNANFTPEFDVETSTNMLDWSLQVRTTELRAQWDSPYPYQFVRVGAHWKL